MKKFIFGLFIIMFLFFSLAYGRCHKDYRKDLPVNAIPLLPTMYSEIYRLMPDFKYPPYFGALIEHESCISLCWKRCWNAKSRLKTKREEGAGLGQITRAYRKNGTLRFDTLTNLKRRYRKELSELNWHNIYNKPKLQIRAMILLWRSNWYRLPKYLPYTTKLAFVDASYNQGYGRTYRDRQMCKLKAGCDPRYWFNNVEKTCTASHKVLYGRRSPCDISRHHVRDVFIRSNKYYLDWIKHKEYMEIDIRSNETIKLYLKRKRLARNINKHILKDLSIKE